MTTASAQPERGRSSIAVDPSLHPEPIGYVRAVYINGAGTDPSADTPGKPSEFSFDVIVNFASGPGQVFTNVGFGNDVPDDDEGYKIRVKTGSRVAVMRTGGFLEFWIQWRPYVKPCKDAAQRGGGANPFKRRPIDTSKVVVVTGGGGPTGLGGAGPSTGAGSDGGVPP